MSIMNSITRRESRPRFSERNKVRTKGQKMKTILKAGAVACGLIAVGCVSKMAALNSDKPASSAENIEGKYVLEKVNAGLVAHVPDKALFLVEDVA